MATEYVAAEYVATWCLCERCLILLNCRTCVEACGREAAAGSGGTTNSLSVGVAVGPPVPAAPYQWPPSLVKGGRGAASFLTLLVSPEKRDAGKGDGKEGKRAVGLLASSGTHTRPIATVGLMTR